MARFIRQMLGRHYSDVHPSQRGSTIEAVQAEMTFTTYELDPSRSHVGFSVRHLLVSEVQGCFHGATATLTLDPSDLERSRVAANIDAATVDTQSSERDEYLRGADFFDVVRHPTMCFVSTRVHVRRGGSLQVTGDLSIRGVTRSVVLDAGPVVPAPDRGGASRVRVSATSSLSRKHFGLVWSKLVETAGAVGDVVKISLQLELVEQAAPPAPHQPIP